MQNSVSIVIPSCDAYQDAWNPFFHCLNRSWSDCPFDKYLIANFAIAPDPGCTTINIGEDIDYCTNLQRALKEIKSDYIILWLEDLLLAARPKGDLQEIVDHAIEMGAGYVKLWQTSDSGRGNKLEEIPRGTKFRVSLKPALWKKSVLEKLLISGESPHDLERKGSKRSNELSEKFYALNKAAGQYRISTTNLIHRGKYEVGALNFLATIGYAFNQSARPIRPRYLNRIEHKILNPILKIFRALWF